MNAYKFAHYPSNSVVASGVTMLVSAWFLVAGGLILTDASPGVTQRTEALALPAATPATAVAPEARLTITVVARRSANL